ncbi:hypothetical protein [Rhodococcus sp. 1168]|uniref:hypothetical protein n=1 Tax=Rhodococcus sp. 1168 TaxID=2018041 RepID=UPI000A0DBE62|nr:hypothetical protein [Rhodococcus sp. 1168]ORI15785.1 hypothetical protein BJI47_01440 [Rhodococcus sp. 1168]
MYAFLNAFADAPGGFSGALTGAAELIDLPFGLASFGADAANIAGGCCYASDVTGCALRAGAEVVDLAAAVAEAGVDA